MRAVTTLDSQLPGWFSAERGTAAGPTLLERETAIYDESLDFALNDVKFEKKENFFCVLAFMRGMY